MWCLSISYNVGADSIKLRLIGNSEREGACYLGIKKKDPKLHYLNVQILIVTVSVVNL